MKEIAKRKSTLIATAYHEAGHAIVCQRLGYKVELVTIVPSDTYIGQCTHENILRRANPEFDNSDRCRMRLEKIIMVSLAGPIAQRLWNPRSVRSYHAQSDHQRAVDFSLRINGTGPSATAYLRWLNLRTEGVIKSSWGIVVAMATDLLHEGTIRVKPQTIAMKFTQEQLLYFWR